MTNILNNIDLITKALQGDEEATRLYCGSYALVKDRNGKLFRCKGKIPFNMMELTGPKYYDKDGFLYKIYWGLPRINI